MTTDLEARLRALRDDLPEPPAHLDLAAVVTTPPPAAVELATTPRAPRHRTRWVVAGLVAAALVVGVLVAVGVVRAGSHTDRRDAVSSTLPARVDPATQVVQVGDRVEGDGQIIAVAGKPVVFCALTPSGATLSPDPYQDCRYRVAVTGVDLGALYLPNDHPANATSAAWISGLTHLAGVYDGDRLTDVVQTPFDPSRAVDELPPPPCAPPTGGWPQVPIETGIAPAVAAYQQAHPDRIVSIALLRASDTQVVSYVLTAGDPAPVEAALAPAVGPALCVERSRYTPAQIAAADAALATTGPLWTRYRAYSSEGPGGVGADAQPQMTVELPMVTDGVVAAVAGLAPGLVQFDPWLSPAR